MSEVSSRYLHWRRFSSALALAIGGAACTSHAGAARVMAAAGGGQPADRAPAADTPPAGAGAALNAAGGKTGDVPLASGGMGGEATSAMGAAAAGRAARAGAGGAAANGGGGSAATATTACASAGDARYVDSSAGLDSNDGLTPATAWQSLAKVNATTFQPGNVLCLKAGDSWLGQLAPKGSGNAAAPIVVDQYGSGDRPRISAGPSDAQALLLSNVAYWEINHLELTNSQAAPGDYRGISVRGRDAGALQHLYIRDCFVHDVTGEVRWIGGDSTDDQPPWVKFKAGWDASKRTGGIVFEVESQSGVRTWFDDVIVENNVIQDTSFGGIIFKQLDAGYGWGVRSSASDAKFTPHLNIVVRNNYVSQTNTKYGCDAIYMTGARHVLIERNVSKDAGTSAIETYNADDVRIQYNELFGTVKKAGGADSNGIDADRATTSTVIQYNYVHDNGDGILLCQFAFGDSVVRYNLIVDNGRHGINLHSDAAAINQTYNNLIMVDARSSANLIATSGNSDQLAASYSIRNNIFRSKRSGAVLVSGGGVAYSNNLFDGVAALGNAPQTGDAMFVDATALPNGTQAGPALAALQGLQLRANSAAIDHGVAIENHGDGDFWGDPLYSGAPDIGPYEAPH